MKKQNKLFIYNIPATFQYEVYAKNEKKAKQILIEQAGYEITGEPIFFEDDFRKAEPTR